MNLRFPFILILLLCSKPACFGNNSVSDEMLLISMRKIGHQILMNDQDSVSRVLPVEKLGAGTFVITFENPFSFNPSELVDIVHQNLQEASISFNYIVEVHDLKDNRVVYSYNVDTALATSNIPCLERNPPTGRYFIKIFLKDVQIQSLGTSEVPAALGMPAMMYTVAFLLFLGLVIFIAIKKHRQDPKGSNLIADMHSAKDTDNVKIGSLSFSMTTDILSHHDKRIELSAKEAKLLRIFIVSQNTIIERDRLLKEVWEDEGVFVGRSLDVFISKLRKKIKEEPNVRLVNIHGRGYKLEVNMP